MKAAKAKEALEQQHQEIASAEEAALYAAKGARSNLLEIPDDDDDDKDLDEDEDDTVPLKKRKSVAFAKSAEKKKKKMMMKIKKTMTTKMQKSSIINKNGNRKVGTPASTIK